MRKFLISLAITAGLASSPATAATVSIACSALGIEYELCKSGTEAWAKKTGNDVKFVSTPNSATDRLALYLQIMAAQSPDIDVFQIDVVWPGLLASHLIDLSAYVPQGLKKQQFPTVIENDTVNGGLVAMPWFIDARLLHYRKDLLDRYGARVPDQWSDLEATAKRVRDAEREAGNTRLWGFVFQARAYEGLTVNALEWIASNGGGTIIGADGEVTVNNPKAIAAIDQAASHPQRPLGEFHSVCSGARFDDAPFAVTELIAHDSMLQFESLNHADQEINGQAARLLVEGERTYSRHRRSGVIDPKRPSGSRSR